MSLHLYCIVPAGRAPVAVAGIDGSPVRMVAAGDVACWVSAHSRRPGASALTLQAHNAVATAAMDRTVTPVPLRFGQWLGDAAAVRRELERASGQWLTLLARFEGHAEYGVRVTAGSAPAAPDAARDVRPVQNSGTEYMAGLARRQAEAAHRHAEGERIAAMIQARAASMIRDSRSEPLATPGGVVSLAHLVAWGDVDAYHAVMQQVSHLTTLRLLCTGPWPPYSFS
jgi:hypothetical protein